MNTKRDSRDPIEVHDTARRVDVQAQRFEDEGLLVVPGAIDEAKRLRLLNAVAAMLRVRIDAHGADKAGIDASRLDDSGYLLCEAMSALNAADHDSIRLMYESLARSEALASILIDEHVIGVARRLMGIDHTNVYVSSNVVRMDVPGDRLFTLDWHQESSYYGGTPASVQVWSPLWKRSSLEAGSIDVCPGSHREGPLYPDLANAGSAAGSRQYTVPPDIVRRYPIETVEIDPGDVVFFSTYLFHKSSDPSLQRSVKYSIVCRYSDANDPSFTPFST
ncbi:MAG: phytanoyl-CoA dioxygenase family protein [Planctomycetota bacterium]|jgi:ectoine hydroxylase-related dioxygenase (phytanoyl-CoA dioxygenase family)